MSEIQKLHAEITACRACPRLVAWREKMGTEKRAAFRDHEYWAKPVPGFGDVNAKLIIFGLAPGAHGSNRTGRMFTGDGSGDFLYPALHRAGLASQPRATGRDDGMKLMGLYITAAVRCAPPDNKPSPDELHRCADWTTREFALLPKARVILALGKIAHDALLNHYGLKKSIHLFAHAAEYPLPDGKILLDSYHVSRQNTQTGKLTVKMFDAIIAREVGLSSSASPQ